MSDLELFNSINNKIVEDEVVPIKDATLRDGHYTRAYPIGYPAIDKAMMGGVRHGDLIIITGKPGQGKTMCAINMAVNLSDRLLPSLFFSYEVMIDNVYAKFAEMDIDTSKLLVYTPKKNTSGSIDWIEKKIREAKEQFNIRHIFIDHLDYLSPRKIRSADEQRHVLGSIIKDLKNLAIELEITVFLLMHIRKIQIGRAIELEDLAETADGGRQADYVFAVARNVTVQNIGGIKTEIKGEYSNLHLLKNRMTGEDIIMEFRVEKNKIFPLDNPFVAEPREIVKESREIIIDNLF